MTKCGAYSGVGNKAMIQVQIRSTNAGPYHFYNCIFGMLYLGGGAVFVCTDPKRSAEIHC